MSNLIHNERIKLTATWLNTISGGLMGAGVFAPLAAVVLGTAPNAIPLGAALVVSSGCFLGGIGLHMAGRKLLGQLRP